MGVQVEALGAEIGGLGERISILTAGLARPPFKLSVHP